MVCPRVRTLEQNVSTGRQGVSAALAAAQARAAVAASVRFPGEDAGRSLSDLAQRDLDATLQLLADRAQYITGASGAAIALRRDGREDMLCRASAGTNAPELGALLSTEFGLSGESVRTKQLLRCDDAERDARVNREVCRQMGIASVLVMPVVNDDQVLGVFELFSGKANAFGERDLSAVQRLSEMVETAVRMARATETLPEQLKERESSLAASAEPEVSEPEVVQSAVVEGQFLSDLVVEQAETEPEDAASLAAAAAEASPAEIIPAEAAPAPAPEPEIEAAPSVATIESSAAKKPLFWSAATITQDETAGMDEADQSNIPPMLRGLRTCEACGFPITAGRVLCVECEEKKWRGQLGAQEKGKKPPAGVSALSVAKSAGPSFAAAAPSMAKAPADATPKVVEKPKADATPAMATPKKVEQPQPTVSAASAPAPVAPTPVPDFVLSAGLEPSRSWFSANKYVLLALLVIGGGMAAFLLLR